MLKTILIVGAIIALLIIAIPVIAGFMSTSNPDAMIQKAQDRSAENSGY